MTITQNIAIKKIIQSEANRFRITTVQSPRVIEYKGSVVQNINYDAIKCIKSTYTCGEIIGGHKVVYLSGGKIYLADKDNPACIGSILGMSNQAGLLDGVIEVILSGEITLNPWGLTQDASYFLGANGAITATVPTTGILYKIGHALDANNLVINHNLLINRN